MWTSHGIVDTPRAMISQQQAVQLADKALTTLQKCKKIDASWQVQLRRETQSLEIDGVTVWVTTYKKPAATGSDSTLYILVDALGNFINANHTGSLSGK